MNGEGSPIAFAALDPHYDEARQRECPGSTIIEVGELDGACHVCGSRTGWLATAATELKRLRDAMSEANPAFAWFAETRHEVLVPVSWTTCDCEYWTKLCGEEHTRYAGVPRSWLERASR